MSGASLNQQELDARIAQAIADGFEVVRGADDVLLLDLDTPAALEQYNRILPCVMEHFSVLEVEEWASKSGHTHVRLKVGYGLPWAMRYALQAALGSDGLREALAIRQMLNGCDEAAILFRPKPVEIVF